MGETLTESAAGLVVVLSTAPDAETGTRIGQSLVGEGLAACVSVQPGLTSIYRWQGVVENSSEHGMTLKTTRERLAEMVERLLELHPYECPEVLVLPVESAGTAYAQWVIENTSNQVSGHESGKGRDVTES